MVKRGEVYWVHLDPTRGSEIRKPSPALVVSPDDMNQILSRVIIAPLTSKGQPLGCRPEIRFQAGSARRPGGVWVKKWAISSWKAGIRC